jgi:hypothetical protein
MKQFWTLLAVCAGLLALPAAASAQSDNLADAPIIANPLPLTPSVLGFEVDNTPFTVEQNEPNSCVVQGPTGAFTSIYGKTFWGLFSADRAGRLDVTSAGADTVISLYEQERAGDFSRLDCTDRLSGRIESFPRDNLPTVSKKGVYALQIGGFQRQDGGIESGPIAVDLELLPPATVEGDAILTWRSARGGVKVTSIKVDGPQGSGALVTCLRKKCGRDQIIRNPKPRGVFEHPVAKVAPDGARSSRGPKVAPAGAKPQVTTATTSAFKGRTIKNGTRLVVAVLGTNQIGRVFFWDVKKNAAGAKSLGCIEPDGTRIQKPGTCDGK